MKINNLQILKYLSITASVILFYLIITSGKDSYFTYGDENGYLENLIQIDKYGFSTEFLRHFSGMAGPLNPMLHWLLRPLTGAVPPGVRLVNFMVLGIIIWQFRNALGYRILFIPMTFICAGYAMTELSAMLCLTCSVFVLPLEANLDVVSKKESVKISSLLGISGILLSFAIAGRWNYLAILPIFWLWVLILFFKENKVGILLFIIGSLLFPAWILYAWGGITPPEAVAVEGYKTLDFEPRQLILSSCFTALIVIMLRPQWLLEMRKNIYVFLYLSIFIFVSNSLLGYYDFLPAKSVFNRFFGEEEKYYFSNFFGSLSICMGLVFFYNLFLHTWKRKQEWNYLFYAICTVMIILTSVKMTTIFSSRYPYQALPFLLLMLKYEEKTETKWWEIILAIGGIAWGILTWFSYQHIYPK